MSGFLPRGCMGAGMAGGSPVARVAGVGGEVLGDQRLEGVVVVAKPPVVRGSGGVGGRRGLLWLGCRWDAALPQRAGWGSEGRQGFWLVQPSGIAQRPQ
jgi:hypothetical protein